MPQQYQMMQRLDGAPRSADQTGGPYLQPNFSMGMFSPGMMIFGVITVLLVWAWLLTGIIAMARWMAKK